jgi:hypothetical protein
MKKGRDRTFFFKIRPINIIVPEVMYKWIFGFPFHVCQIYVSLHCTVSCCL